MSHHRCLDDTLQQVTASCSRLWLVMKCSFTILTEKQNYWGWNGITQFLQKRHRPEPYPWPAKLWDLSFGKHTGWFSAEKGNHKCGLIPSDAQETVVNTLWKAPNENGILQYNTACLTSETTTKNGWEVLLHPPYGLDLVPSDYHLFKVLKDEHIRGWYYECDDAIQETTCCWLWGAGTNFYHSEIFKLM